MIVTFTWAGSCLKYIHFQNLILLKPSIFILKAKGSGVQGHLQLSSKFEASLDNMRPLNKLQTKTNPLHLKKQAIPREQNSKSYIAQHILQTSQHQTGLQQKRRLLRLHLREGRTAQFRNRAHFQSSEFRICGMRCVLKPSLDTASTE